jgi:hypothetical protein
MGDQPLLQKSRYSIELAKDWGRARTRSIDPSCLGKCKRLMRPVSCAVHGERLKRACAWIRRETDVRPGLHFFEAAPWDESHIPQREAVDVYWKRVGLDNCTEAASQVVSRCRCSQRAAVHRAVDTYADYLRAFPGS